MNNVLVTGGSGSWGNAFVRALLAEGTARRIIVYSRGEYAQAEMQAALAAEFGRDVLREPMRFFIGDVRDQDRLRLAMRGCDTVVHAAALKRVDALEYNPTEAVRTNVAGAMNVIECAIANGVERVVGLSSDKATNPVNLYGATKLCMEKLFVAANMLSGSDGPRFACVRYGNVAGSRGSVLPLWARLRAEGKPLPVTDAAMSRFWMTLPQAVAFVRASLGRMYGGEVFVPRLPSVRIVDVAEAMDPGRPHPVIGLRPGEKLHEAMIGPDEPALRLPDDGFVLMPAEHPDLKRPAHDGIPMLPGFGYTSGGNDWWLEGDELVRAVGDALGMQTRRAA